MTRIVKIATAALLCLLTTAIAQQKWQFPDSPTGKTLTALLTTIEKGGEERIEEFVENYYAADFREAMPMSQHLGALQSVHQMLGEVDIVSLEKPNQFAVDLVLEALASGELFAISMELAETEPHGIIGLQVEPYREATPPPVPPTETEYSDTLAVIAGELGGKLHDFMLQQERNGFSGAVIVVKNGKTVLHRGYGWADRERRIANTTQTVFDLASYAKAFTQVAILQLEHHGKLSTEDPISKFFENVPEDKQAITIDQLLTFRSGLHEYHDTSGDFEQMTREEALATIMAQELRFEPGTDWGYSNSGFAVLAAIVEEVSGEEYLEYCHRNLFEPAAMLHTGFYQDPRWREDQVAVGDDAHSYGEQNSPYHWPQITWACIGGGCVCSSPGDQGRWLRALNTGRILQGVALEKLHSVYKKPLETEWAGATLAFAEGNDFGFTGATYEFPADESFVFVSSNTGSYRAPKAAEKLAKMLFD